MSSATGIPAAVIGDGVMARWLSMAMQQDRSFEPTSLDEALIVFDAGTLNDDDSLRHKALKAGRRVVALIPLASAPPIIPTINIDAARGLRLVGVASSLAQATVPLVDAVSKLARVDYAEAVGHIASDTIDTGDRTHLDELVSLTRRTLVSVGGAQRAKACLLVSSCVPAVCMRIAVHCLVAEPFEPDQVEVSIKERVELLKQTVGSYRLCALKITGRQVTIRAIVASTAADTSYAGNLDIMATTAFCLARFMASCKE